MRARTVIGIDTGGTFTDVVRIDAGPGDAPARVRIAKVPSTPHDPAEAFLAGLREVLGPADGARVVHGTTVATNALLERKVAKTALVTNRDMEDLVEIGRQARPDLYALHPRKPPALVPRELRFGVGQRTAADGSEIAREDPAEVDAIAAALAREGVEAVAVCLLHAYRDGSAERRIAERLAALGIRAGARMGSRGDGFPATGKEPGIRAEARTGREVGGLPPEPAGAAIARSATARERARKSEGFPITCSAALLPEIREVERFETAIANAALTPVLARYLERIEREVGGGATPGPSPAALRRVLVMRSDGGLAPAGAIAREPVRTLLSGPAGGVVGAARAARRAGLGPFISIDVGGTSTDVATGVPATAAGAAATGAGGEVGGVRVAVPSLDIVSVGAGGGSIAWIDAGGALRVGPRSAGASPGPACYARGPAEEAPATLTDAALVLGRLDPRFFLGGAMTVDPTRAAAAIERAVARPLGIAVDAAAAGIVEVALAATERALRRVTIERGEDPRERDLVAFGGAGGLLAAPLAERLGVRRVLVPEHPGLLSALGMAEAPLLFERSQALLAPLGGLSGGILDRSFQNLEVAVLAAMAAEGVEARDVRLARELDLRYEGQAHELRLAYRAGSVATDFHAMHERRNGFRDEGRAIEVVAAHVTALAEEVALDAAPARRAPASGGAPAPAPIGRSAAGALFRREDLAPGAAVAGPAIVGEYSGTTYVPAGWRAAMLESGDLLLERIHG